MRLVALFIAALGAGFIALAPLSAALSWAQAEKAGLTAEQVHGSIWRGTLQGARFNGAPLGDLQARVEALLTGQSRIHLVAEGGRATLLSGREQGVEDADWTLSAAPLGLGLPGALGLEDVSAVFKDGRCVRAAGTISLDALSRATSGPSLNGPVTCDGGLAVARLTGGTGVSATLSVTSDGAWELETRIAGGVPAQESAAALAGFARTDQGLVRRDQGRLGQRP